MKIRAFLTALQSLGVLDHERNIVLGAPGMRVAALDNVYHGVGGAGEQRCAVAVDVRQAFRQIDPGEGRAALESAAAQGKHPFGDDYFAKRAAAAECTPTDGFNARRKPSRPRRLLPNK